MCKKPNGRKRDATQVPRTDPPFATSKSPCEMRIGAKSLLGQLCTSCACTDATSVELTTNAGLYNSYTALWLSRLRSHNTIDAARHPACSKAASRATQKMTPTFSCLLVFLSATSKVSDPGVPPPKIMYECLSCLVDDMPTKAVVFIVPSVVSYKVFISCIGANSA